MKTIIFILISVLCILSVRADPEFDAAMNATREFKNYILNTEPFSNYATRVFLGKQISPPVFYFILVGLRVTPPDTIDFPVTYNDFEIEYRNEPLFGPTGSSSTQITSEINSNSSSSYIHFCPDIAVVCWNGDKNIDPCKGEKCPPFLWLPFPILIAIGCGMTLIMLVCAIALIRHRRRHIQRYILVPTNNYIN